MLPIPNSVIKAQKKVASTAAVQNILDQHVYASMTLQNKCMFEVIMYPEVVNFKKTGFESTENKSAMDITKSVASTIGKNITDNLGAITSVAQDFLMTRYYLYQINEIPLMGFDYQRYGGLQGIKDCIYGDEISMTFIEDSLGLTKRYLSSWMDDIGTYDPKSRDFIFKDNQHKCKRTCLILPYQEIMIPSVFGWMMIQGLKLKQITGIGYDHSDGSNELITVSFTMDNIIFRDIANNAITDMAKSFF